MAEEKRIVVIGGVAGGASAAARARRLDEDAEIILIERGDDVSFANCGLPYHIGGVIADRDRLLVQTPQKLYENLRIDVRTRTEAVRIDRQRREVVVRQRHAAEEQIVSYDKLVLSPGAEAVRPSIPGIEDDRVHTLRTMADMDGIIETLQTMDSSAALIVGGGYIGLEMAEALRSRQIAVTLVEMSSQVMSPLDQEMTAPLHQHIRLHGVDLRLETSLTALVAAKDGLKALFSDGAEMECGLVILAVGVRPETGLAREAGLEIGPRGGIAVDEHMRSSDPHIYAVGDAVEVEDFSGGFKTLLPLAGPANRQGRIAADNALGRESVYRHTQGTGICKVFELAAAVTGLNEKTLKRLGRPYQKVYIHPASHAGYYPGAAPISLKLLYDPDNGRILGAQAVGREGVDKRIDVLAVALRAGLSVFDLEDLELAYAPPYGSARDPVNYAGFVAANSLRGDVSLCQAEDMIDPGQDQYLLDVRSAAETAAGTIPGAVNIPLPELRDRLDEIPREREIMAFCQVGLRGYLACRILSQRGYRCRNLSGGYRTYAMVREMDDSVCMGGEEMRDDAGAVCRAVGGERSETAAPVRVVDASGLQCPGPIMRLADEIADMKQGEALSIISSDPGFPADIGPWCRSTGNTLLEAVPEDGRYRATIVKGSAAGERQEGSVVSGKEKTIVVFSGDFDKAMAAFIIANGAAAMGSSVTMFFTFWGLNVLRKPESVRVQKTFIEKMLGWMMPRGAGRLQLSNMNMGGMGAAMIKAVMRSKNVASLTEMIESAQRAGVRLVACNMSMDLMGIKREELIEGVDEGGVASYLDKAEAGNVNLFI